MARKGTPAIASQEPKVVPERVERNVEWWISLQPASPNERIE
jgi:hypothetical protein